MATKKLIVKIHQFYFSNEVWVKWFPVKEDGKASGQFTVVIEFPPTDRGNDTVKSLHSGPPSAAASLHHLKWAIKDRQKKP